MQKVKTKKNNLAIPGEPMSEAEFHALIREAEKGPFYTLEESKKIFEKWKKKRYKL